MRPKRPARVTLFVLSFLVLFPTLAAADTRMLHLSFTAAHQSMWGPGSAAPPFSKRFTLVDPNTVRFDVSTSGYPGYVGPHVSVDTFFWGDVDFGVFARARAGAHVGLFADVAVPNPGSVDVTYPLNTKLTFPDANSFRAGDTVTISAEYTDTAVTDGFLLKTTSPKASLEMKGDFGLHLDAYAKGCIVVCLDTTQILGLPSPIIDTEPGEFRIFKVDENSSIATPPQFGLISPISGDIHTPNINLTGTVDANHRSLVANGDDSFVNVSLDLGAVLEDLIDKLPALSFNSDDYGSFGVVSGVHFHYLLLGANANAHLKAVQNFRFDADPKVAFSFPEPLQFWVNGGAPTTSTNAEMKVGDTLHLVTSLKKDPPTPVTPTFRLDNQFHTDTGFDVAEDVEVSAGSLGLEIPSITIIPALCIPGFCIDFGLLGEACVPDICTPSVSFDPPGFDIGPLYDHDFPIGQQHLGTLFTGTWQMTGFPTATADALSLDPENPIIAIKQQTGMVRNLGSGKRLVPFVIDLSNPGDVKLSQISLHSNLQDAFSNARSYNVDHVTSCGFNLDATFDGNGNVEVLVPGNELLVQGSKRVVLYAVVSPKPDPAPYTDRSDGAGRSQLGTPVNDSTTSSVLLGPSNPASAADFVFFGDQFVKFDTTGDIFGNVGSNNTVEIKNGASGVVAGDLRAFRYVKVNGSVSADYAFSGGVIDVVGNGSLTLFGNAKPFQTTMSMFTMTTPPFAPASPLAGDVWVPLNGSATLEPGYYGYVTVNTGGTLELHPGTYYINQLLVRNGAKVNFDKPVTANVMNIEVGAGAAISGNGSSRDSIINDLQTSDLTTGNGSSIRATFIAPRSNLLFGAQSALEGSFFGKSITLNAGVTASYHKDCDPLIDANCDGIPDCQ